MNENMKQLKQQVERVAEIALAKKGYVSPIDVLVGIGWLPRSVLDQWRQGRLANLERGIQRNLHKISTAMHLFRSWATRRGLRPSETIYVTNRGRQPLRFSVTGQERIERGYRTHWVSSELSGQKPVKVGQHGLHASSAVGGRGDAPADDSPSSRTALGHDGGAAGGRMTWAEPPDG